MCIVIDLNVLAAVLNPFSSKHSDFQPVEHWISDGKGKFVYGGTTYIGELSRASKYLGIISEWERKGKTVRLCDAIVDAEESRIRELVDDPDFDDPHLAAIVSASRCRLICSEDKRAYPFLTRRDLYPKGVRRPRIYRDCRNAALLCDRYLSPCCK